MPAASAALKSQRGLKELKEKEKRNER